MSAVSPLRHGRSQCNSPRQTARQVEDYRQRFQIDDPDWPLGQPPTRDHDPERQQAWRQANGAIQRMQARQQRGLDRDPQPGSVRNIAAAERGEPTSRHAAARDPNPVQGPERVAG